MEAARSDDGVGILGCDETEHPHPHGRRNHQYGIQGFFHLGECETQPSTTDVVSSLEMNTHAPAKAVCLLVYRKVGELIRLDLPLQSSSISKVEEANAFVRFVNGGTRLFKVEGAPFMKLLVTLVLLELSESFSSKSMDDKLETT